MSISKELYNLQEIDRELASDEQARSLLVEQLKGNPEIVAVQNSLETANQRQKELAHSQRTLEQEVEDISSRLKKFADDLYSGRTTNTKELSSLQQEIEILTSKRDGLEDRELELMESVEQANTTISKLTALLKKLEAAWQENEIRLSAALEGLIAKIATLKENRNSKASTFDSDTLNLYEKLKIQRGTAAAKVERGICQGCRIQLPIGELQQVRGGDMVRCSSCGRILLLDQ